MIGVLFLAGYALLTFILCWVVHSGRDVVDGVDEHARTAAALLAPDSLPDDSLSTQEQQVWDEIVGNYASTYEES